MPMKKCDCFAYNPRLKNSCEALKDAYCPSCPFYKTRGEYKEELAKLSKEKYLR